MRVLRGLSIKNKIFKFGPQQFILLFFVAVLSVSIAMPNQVMAIQLQNLANQPKQPSVLPAEKVDTTKDQAIRDSTVGSPLDTSKKKADRTYNHEILSKRTPFTSTYVNKDGSKSLAYSVEQQNYQVGNTWEKIDNKLKGLTTIGGTLGLQNTISSITPDSSAPTSFSGKAGKIDAQMKSLSAGLDIAQSGKTINMRPVGARDVTPVRNDDRTVVYKNAWNGVDLEYQLRGESVKETIVINKKLDNPVFDFAISGGRVIPDPAKAGAYTIEGMPSDFNFSDLTINVNNQGVISEQHSTMSPTATGIRVTVDKKWLSSLGDNDFPVQVDPTWGYRDASAYWMFKSDGYSCGSNTCYANTGSINSSGWKHWRTYFQIPNIDQLAGKHIQYANLHGYYKTGQGGTGVGYGRYMGHANCIAFNCQGTYVGGQGGVGGDFDINFTGGMQQSVNNSDWGTVWSLWGDECGCLTFKPYYNLSAVIVYDTPTPQATPINPANGGVIVSTQPTLRVNPLTNPDGAVRYYYRVSTSKDAETGAVINSGWIYSSQWTVPDGILQDGTTYYWHVYTWDNSTNGQITDPRGVWVSSFKLNLRTGKDSTQSYDNVGPMGIDLATGNTSTSAETHSISALGGNIGLSLNYNTPTKAKYGLTGQYWNVPANYGGGVPSGPPNLTRTDQDINYNWPNGSSPDSSIQTDWFYARWQGYFVAPTAGTYQFGANTDDATDIYVNNQLQLSSSCYTGVCYNGSISLTAGQVVPIDVRYLEATGNAYMNLYVKGAVPEQIVNRDWFRTAPVASEQQYGLNGRYFTDDGSHTFPTDPARLMMARQDSSLNFNWSGSGPAAGLQGTSFLTRWTGYVTVPTDGSYTFGAYVNDGVKVTLKNGFMGADNVVVNSWNDKTGTANVTGTATSLTHGQAVPITIEYYQAAGSDSTFELTMSGPGLVGQQDIPVKWLTPKASALPGGWQLGVSVDGSVGYERLRVAGSNVILEDSSRATHEYTWTGLAGATTGSFKPPVNEDGQLTRNANNTYTFIDSDGRTYVFDAEGKLTSLTSATDVQKPASLKYTYSGDPSRLVAITDGVTDTRFGTLYYKSVNDDSTVCPIPTNYDSAPDGMLCAFKTSDGDFTRFYYKLGQLSRIEKPGNELTDFGYDSFSRIINTRDSLANDAITAGVRPDDASDNVLKTEIGYDYLGRVNSVKSPAATIGATRQTNSFEYLPSATQMHITGASEPNGFSKRIEYDSLLRTTKGTDLANLSSTNEWDAVKDLLLSNTDPTGLKSTTIYDDEDRPIANYGPAPSAWYDTTRAPLTSYTNQVPKSTAAYDEGLVGPALDWFNVKGSSLVGAPKLLTQGLDQTQKNWLGRSFVSTPVEFTPDPGMDGYGFSATGKIRFPSTGTYTFKAYHDDGARLAIDDQVVINNWDYRSEGTAQTIDTGTFVVTDNSKPFRFKYDYLHVGNPGAVDLWIAGNGITDINSGLGTDKPNFITPDYSLRTSEKTYDSQLGNTETKTTYGNPAYQLVANTTIDPTGLNLVNQASYGAPGTGYLRQNSRTTPGGSVYTYNNYGATDPVDNPCTAASDSAIQAGLSKGVTQPDPDGAGPLTGKVTENVYDAGGTIVATRTNTDPWTCFSFDTRGRQVKSEIPSVNGRPGRTIQTNYNLGGNPLVIQTVDSVAGTSTKTIDLSGRVIAAQDVWGNSYTTSYNDWGGVSQKTSPLGTETYAYDSLYRTTGYSLDSTLLATVTYDSYGRVNTVTYPEAKDSANNKLKLTQVKRDNVGRASGSVYTTSDGKTYDETAVMSQLGKITGVTQTYDGQTLASNFGYDSVGRLTSATVGQTKFDYGYATPDATTCSSNSANNSLANKNSNRTSYKVTNVATSAVAVDDKLCYNFADQLTYSTDASIGTPTYDDHGNTTSFGGSGVPLTFSYNAADYNIAVEQGTKKTEYIRTATGEILRKKEFDSNSLTASYRYVAGGSVLQACSLTDDNSCSTVDRYVLLPGNVSLTLAPSNPDPNKQIVYSLYNYHGDTALTLTTEGKTTSSSNGLLAYGAFGEQLLAGTQGTTLQTKINASDQSMGWAAYPTRKQDQRYTTTFVQMGARVYIPTLGRFLQTDPVEGGTLNAYVYSHDPINSDDYSGKFIPLLLAIVSVAVRVIPVVIRVVQVVTKAAQAAAAAAAAIRAAAAAAAAARAATAARAAAAAAAAAQAAKKAAQATKGASTAQQKYQAGMSASNTVQSTSRVQSVLNPERYRVPDGLTSTALTEVKNVQYQSWTSQLRDYSAISQRDGLSFTLKINSGARTSGPLEQAFDDGLVNILRY